MIITLEHDGQPCLDSSSDKKVPFDLLLPEQSYYPEGPVHPVFRHVNVGYAGSISTASDARSVVTTDSHPTDFSTTRGTKRWRMFNSSFLLRKRPLDDPLLSRSTMVEKPRRAKSPGTVPRSCCGFRRRWLVAWFLLSMSLCLLVAFGVWAAMRRNHRPPFFQPLNTEWSPEDSNIYSSPPEQFGCYNEPSSSVLNGSQVLISVPPGQAGQHTFTIQGGASGHVTLASSPDPNSAAITYDIAIQSNPPSLNGVSFNQPPPGPPITANTDFLLDTPINMVQTSATDPPACMRFDITVYIPRNLRQLTVNVSTPVQITFSPQGHVELDDLSIFTSSSHPKCLIDASESLQAKSITVEMYTGLMQGFLTLGESSKITNWNGQIKLDTIPNVSIDFYNPSKVLLQTMSSGKVDIRYLRNHAYRKRPIESWHTMGIEDKSIGRFDYGCSGFNGLLFLNSTKYNITNAGSWQSPPAMEGSWPIAMGNRTGEDKIYIISGSGSIFLPVHSS